MAGWPRWAGVPTTAAGYKLLVIHRLDGCWLVHGPGPVGLCLPHDVMVAATG